MDENIIRSILLFAIGVVLILFPKRIFRFQAYVIGKLRPQHDVKYDRNYNVFFGVILIVVSMILLGVALT